MAEREAVLVLSDKIEEAVMLWVEITLRSNRWRRWWFVAEGLGLLSLLAQVKSAGYRLALVRRQLDCPSMNPRNVLVP